MFNDIKESFEHDIEIIYDIEQFAKRLPKWFIWFLYCNCSILGMIGFCLKTIFNMKWNSRD